MPCLSRLDRAPGTVIGSAVTGALAGAVHGVGAVPQRWTDVLHVPLPGFGDRVLRTADLAALTGRPAS